MATLLLATAFGATATLNYNNITNTGTSITVDNTAGSRDVIFSTVISGIPTSVTVMQGTSTQKVFPSALAVTIKPNTCDIAGLSQSTFQGVPA